jgi:hypothetical protein
MLVVLSTALRGLEPRGTDLKRSDLAISQGFSRIKPLKLF